LKQRPCVVLSLAEFNGSHPDVMLAAVTSQVNTVPGEDEYVQSEREWKAAALPKPSMVKAGKIVTVDQRLVRKAIGQLPLAAFRRVRAAVRRII
jgi:mRNA-degrading endonuclease toxin of MazEF toxin-antitoxin module